MIYLDYHATTPTDSRVAEKVMTFMTTLFGNASSIDHLYGDQASTSLKQASCQVAELIHASPKEVIFTSGATESLNLAIQGHINKQNKPSRLIISPVEHKAVLDICIALEKKGLSEIVWLKIDQQAQIDLDYLEKACANGGSLLCVMAANNEVGTIYPIQKIGHIAQKYHIPFLCDASQAVGKSPINFQEWGITYLTLSGHKIYGPKGVGALIIKKGYQLEPLIYGGGQQNGIRPGTLNVPGIVGLGEACYLRQIEMEQDEKIIAQKRDHLQTLLLEKIPNLVINGDIQSRLAGNLNISIPDIPNSAIIARIRDKMAISTGSACSSGVPSSSHVLRAMKLSENVIDGALRIGLGKFTTEEEIEQAAEFLIEAKINCENIANLV
ncbi:MAG: aminotransferase [Snowella sp.]|nr:MAG: aminotransferase [Snowella sp.]